MPAVREAVTRIRTEVAALLQPDTMPDVQDAEALAVMRRADVLAPFANEVTKEARKSIELLNKHNPDALFSAPPDEDALYKFSVSDAVLALEDKYPKAKESLRVSQENAGINQQQGSTGILKPEDYLCGIVCADLYLATRRQFIVEKVTEAIKNKQVTELHTIGIRQVAAELAEPARNPAAETALENERNTYSGELIRLSVRAANQNVGSLETKRYREAYQVIAGDKDSNVINRAVSDGIGVLRGITKKAEIPGQQLGKTTAELKKAFATGQIPDTSSDLLVFKSFLRLVGQTHQTVVRQIGVTDPDVEFDKLQDLWTKAGLLEDFSEAFDWPMVDISELEARKLAAQAARKRIGRAATRPEIAPDGIILVEDPKRPGSGTIRTITTAVMAGATVATLATPAVAATHAAQWTPPGQREGTTYVAVSTDHPATTYTYENPSAATSSDSSSGLIPADSTTSTAPEQSPSDASPDPSQPSAPPSTESSPAPQPADPTNHNTPAHQAAPSEVTTPSPLVAEDASQGDFTYTTDQNSSSESSSSTSEIVKSPTEMLRDYIQNGKEFNRTDAYALFRQLRSLDTSTTLSDNSTPTPPEVQTIINTLLAQDDQAYNIRRGQMTIPERTDYVLPTLYVQAALDDNYEAFLATNDPSELYVTGKGADAVRYILDKQLSADIKEQLGVDRYKIILQLMTTAELQVLNQHQIDEAIAWYKLDQQSTDVTPDHQVKPPHHSPRHPDNHQANGHHHNKPNHNAHHNRHNQHHAPHESGPNLEGLDAGQIRVIEAIYRHTVGEPRVRDAMIFTSYLEAGLRPDARGNGSYGAYQEQNPGDPNGPHPDWSIAGALNPDTATQDMLPDYHNGVSQVHDRLWKLHPMLAVELAGYHAERPADIYHNTQGWGRVKEAYDVMKRITGGHSQHGPGQIHGIGHGHGHGNGHNHGHMPQYHGGSAHSAAIRRHIVRVALRQEHRWPNGVTDNNNSNPIIAKYTEGRLGPQWAWCAFFATYDLQQAGLQHMPRIGLVSDLYKYMVSPRNKSFYVRTAADIRRSKAEVKPGDAAFFNENASYYALEHSGRGNHVGIVVKVEGDIVTTVDGNWNDRVSFHTFNINDPTVMAFADYTG